MNIYISNLSYAVNDGDLKDLDADLVGFLANLLADVK